MEHKDTYFIDSEIALKVAKCNNKVLARNKLVEATQICYYDGKEIEEAPRNCIHVPFKNFTEYFVNEKNRIPSSIDSTEKKHLEIFNEKLNIVNKKIDEKIKSLEEKSRKLQPNFNDKKLRIFAHACRETVLIKYIIENIMKAALNLNLEIYTHKQENDLQSCSMVTCLEAYCNFNPHLTININHLNNHFLSKNVFNFIWFQDAMPALLDDTKVHTRSRDYVFHLTKGLGEMLSKKGIHSLYQSFCIDTNIYKNRENIKRKKKIVFIGSSYLKDFSELMHKDKNILCKVLFKEFFKDGSISLTRRNELIKEYRIDIYDLGLIMNYIERDLSLEYIVDLSLDYEIEIYGMGWDKYDHLKKYYKGVLSYGKDISKIYNSAQYSLVLGGYVLQLRTLESAASGCIPIVIDTRNNKGAQDEECFNESLLFIQKLDDIKKLLTCEHEVDLNCIVKNHHYEQFVNNILKLVDDGLNK